MFRGSLHSKFKTYSKSLQTFKQAANKNGRIFDILPENINIFDVIKNNKAFQNYRDRSCSSNISQSCSKVLSAVQNIIDEKRTTIRAKQENKKIRDIKRLIKSLAPFQNHLAKNKFLYSTAAAVSVAAETNLKDETSNTTAPDSIVESSSSLVTDPIPEPPPVPEPTSVLEDVGEALVQLNELGEPTFASLGLGGGTPVGWVQSCFEYLHVSLGIPWWEAIVIGTLVIRLFMFPLVILAQRNAAKMNNYLPQMQAIQLKMTEARQTGNQLDAARYSQELVIFMREKGINPFKNMLVPLAQMPIFISFFMGLRQMANVPVESLRTGGIFWFTDLTVPDQYFLMPMITSATLWLTIELGTDTAKLSAQNLQTMKYVLRALPVVILPFTVNFPGAILCYWVSSNFISLAQVGLLRIPVVRDFFKIEPLVTYKPEHLPIKPKGFTEGLKESWTNMKITNELEERRKLDEMQFQRAGKGPIVKTYKFDPTKQSTPSAISAKKR